MIQTTVKVSGMACSMCESHVCDTIRNQFQVKKVNIYGSLCTKRPGNDIFIRMIFCIFFSYFT